MMKPQENSKFFNEAAISGLKRRQEPRPRSENLMKENWRWDIWVMRTKPERRKQSSRITSAKLPDVFCSHCRTGGNESCRLVLARVWGTQLLFGKRRLESHEGESTGVLQGRGQLEQKRHDRKCSGHQCQTATSYTNQPHQHSGEPHQPSLLSSAVLPNSTRSGASLPTGFVPAIGTSWAISCVRYSQYQSKYMLLSFFSLE